MARMTRRSKGGYEVWRLIWVRVVCVIHRCQVAEF